MIFGTAPWLASQQRSCGTQFFLGTLDTAGIVGILSITVTVNTIRSPGALAHSWSPFMPANARRDIVDEDRVGVYHCIARCVRRAFLCGTDPYSGRDYNHRKAWIRDRLRHLAGLFGVDVCEYAVMSNHMHVVLRNRPDIVQRWPDSEVAFRWRKLFPRRSELTSEQVEPDQYDIAVLTADAEQLAVLRHGYLAFRGS